MARLSTDAQPFVLHICGNPKAVALIRHQFLHIEAKAQNQEDPVRKRNPFQSPPLLNPDTLRLFLFPARPVCPRIPVNGFEGILLKSVKATAKNNFFNPLEKDGLIKLFF